MNNSAYDIELLSIDGSYNIMESVKGKLTLVTNIASKLGYDPKCSVTFSYARTCKYLWELEFIYQK